MAVSPEEHERVLASLGEAKASLGEAKASLGEAKTRIEQLEEQLATLLAAMEKLRGELKKNSSNSNLPPSGDGPGAASRGIRKSSKAKSKRKRGGQKGHKGSHRVLVEASEVDAFEDFYPEACEACASLLPQVADETARRYQRVDLVRGGVHVVEYRRHGVECPCDHTTMAPQPEEHAHPPSRGLRDSHVHGGHKPGGGAREQGADPCERAGPR